MPLLLHSFARQIDRRLSKGSFDIVFAPSTIPIAGLRCSQPIVFWTDAVIDDLLDYYPGPHLSRATPRSIELGRAQERRALTHASLCVYSSRWAADGAARYYAVEEDRLLILPFGCNLEGVPSGDEVAAMVDRRDCDRCRLLFIGVDWLRKGGPIAVETVAALSRLGIAAELTVIGAPELRGTLLPEGVRYLGFVDKNTADGRAVLSAELAAAHYLILPTLADATPVVISEASAFGVPVLTTRTGGIPEIVDEGRNGWMFPVGADGAAYAARIADDRADPASYRRLALAARRLYDTRLAWPRNIDRLIDRMELLR